jgi:hypothetical protein
MTAASTAGTLKFAIDSGGKASLSLIPAKILIALFLLISVLAVALSVPGIQYVGQGLRKPKAIHQEKKGTENEKENRANDEVNKELQRELGQIKQKRGRDNQPDKQPSTSWVQKIFALFAAIGKLLLIPVIIFFIGFMIYILAQLWPVLKGVSGIGSKLRQWLSQLFGSMNRDKSQGQTGEPVQAHPDPVELMKTINTLEPRDAVLTAYRCLLGFLERMGHTFQSPLTPYEILASIPQPLGDISKPAQLITNHYINTAFGTTEPSLPESKEVIDALFAVQLFTEKNQGQVKSQ